MSGRIFRLTRHRELRLAIVPDPRGPSGEPVLEFRLWRCTAGGAARPTAICFFSPLRLVISICKAAIDLRDEHIKHGPAGQAGPEKRVQRQVNSRTLSPSRQDRQPVMAAEQG
jgi:hypothetical protein